MASDREAVGGGETADAARERALEMAIRSALCEQAGLDRYRRARTREAPTPGRGRMAARVARLLHPKR